MSLKVCIPFFPLPNLTFILKQMGQEEFEENGSENIKSVLWNSEEPRLDS